MIFENRIDAGERLSQALRKFENSKDTIIIALARGGVPVGEVISKNLNLPLEILVVRKIGAPGDPELALGAIAEGGGSFIDRLLVKRTGISPEEIDESAKKELVEITRRIKEYKRAKRAMDVEKKTVIIVDDGIATGATMKAAIRTLRMRKPHKMITAAPVVSKETADDILPEVDELIYLSRPEIFTSVGSFYKDFGQVSDEDVKTLINES